MANQFVLDPRLERDSVHVLGMGLCDLRLSHDGRWPWLILVPKRSSASEIFDLKPLDQALLAFETELTARALKTVTGARKINIGSLGNIVSQLHVHVIARFEGDPNWPGPVWGYGQSESYASGKQQHLINEIRKALSA